MEKVEKVTVSVAIVLFDMKYIPIQSLRNTRGQGQRSLVICLSTFSKEFDSETTRLILIKFHMQSLDRGGKESLYISIEGEKKVYIFRPGHMTKVDAMPIHGKNVKKSSTP